MPATEIKKIMKIPWTIIHQQINKLDNPRNEWLSRDIKPIKTGSWRNRKSKNPITNKEVESVIKVLPTKKSWAPHGFTREFWDQSMMSEIPW